MTSIVRGYVNTYVTGYVNEIKQRFIVPRVIQNPITVTMHDFGNIISTWNDKLYLIVIDNDIEEN